MIWLLVAITTPIVFFLLTWGVVSAVRVFSTESPVHIDRASTFVRRRSKAGKVMAVATKGDSARLHGDLKEETYVLTSGWSSGIPDTWNAELWIRRN